MRFLDQVKVFVQAGSGGDGCCSFFRAKFIPRGGPDGGNGGRGGDVYFYAVSNTSTLADFRKTIHIRAKNGKNGMGKLRHGLSGESICLPVPVGTQVFSEDGEVCLFDFIEAGQKELIAKSGHGGRGNHCFKSSTRRTPYISEKGEPGEFIVLILSLKLIAQVGIIGMPNAGKSSYLQCVTNAHPKIADYPFTTLYPNLGIADVYGEEVVIADIPGLLENASSGYGLGYSFLKHVERTSIHLHVLDATDPLFEHNYRVIKQEIEKYNPEILKHEEIIILNKADLCPDDIEEKAQIMREISKKKVFITSTTEKKGLRAPLEEASKILTQQKVKVESQPWSPFDTII